MSNYINFNFNIGINEFMCSFKEFFKRIKDILSQKVFKKENQSIDELVDLYSQDEEFLNNLNSLKTLLDGIKGLLKEVSFIRDEYISFLSIRNMISYILDDLYKFFRYYDFIRSLISSFRNLIVKEIEIYQKFDINDYDKTEVLVNSFLSYYEKVYDEFDDFMDQQENYFYTEIFDYSDKYDDLIVDVTKALN